MKRKVEYLLSKLRQRRGIRPWLMGLDLRKAWRRYDEGLISVYDMMFEIGLVEDYLDE